MKSNSENNEVKKCVLKKCKEKYVKKLNKYRKYNIIIFIVFFIYILIDIILTWDLGKKPFFGRYIFSCLEGKTFHIIVFLILSLVYLFHNRISKNEYFKNKNEIRFLVDTIFIFEFFYLILLDIELLLPIFVKNNIDMYEDFLILLLTVSIVYIFNSILLNLLKISYFYFIVFSVGLFLAGWISVENFGLISLIVIVINQFMSYDDVLNVYSKLKIDYDDIKVDEIKTNKQIAINKLYFNISIAFLYIYISLTEYFSIYGFIPKLSDEKVVPKLLLISFKGFNRIIIIEIIVIIYAICLKVKKKSIKEEIIKFKQKFEVILMKFIEKYIIRTK